MRIGSNKIVNGESQKGINLLDNGGRRLGFDRRVYSYSFHIPERRNGKDRRNGSDRRKTIRDPALY